MERVDVGKNIQRIRIMKGLSQVDCADKSGITRLALANIEKNASNPKSSTVMAIAATLGVPMHELFRAAPTMHAVRFRSKKALSTRERNEREYELIRLSQWLADYHEVEEFVGDTKPFALERLTAQGPVAMAQEARKALGLSDHEPIYGIGGLLAKAGIKLYVFNLASMKKVFGLSVGVGEGGPVIGINCDPSISIERRIFTAAHELGHVLMHHASYDVDEVTEHDQEEKEADMFAGEFLMPDAAFRHAWNATRGEAFVDRVLQIKRIFRVSYKVVLHRLIVDGGHDSQHIHMKFATEYQRKYSQTLKDHFEPDGLVEHDFVNDGFTGLVRDALEKEAISMSRAAEMLGITMTELRERFTEWSRIP